MKKTSLQIPSDIGYLSEWKDFDSHLPQGKIIVNKVHCGCGMTHYYLTAPMPVILISPRRNLIHSKINDSKLSDIHYYDREDQGISKGESDKLLEQYVSYSPFSYGSWTPKILVTYDSFPGVITVLDRAGIMNKFTIVVDEFSCLFTDARLKGRTDLQLLTQILSLPNRTVFISATPIKEDYLDKMEELRNMMYVNLEWDSRRLRTISLTERSMASTQSAIKNIINDYRQTRYFQQKIISNICYNSTEAVFYLNSVSDICKIIKSEGLTKSNTRVICANADKNKSKLKGLGFDIDCFPSRQQYKTDNKTFTFVTKASFEGADLYSDCATTYIFADSNRDSLSLDISIDLGQIIGRCRTYDNPFINDVILYYKTTDRKKFNYLDLCQKIEEKRLVTENGLKVNIAPSDLTLRKYKQAQEHSKYNDDYIDVMTDTLGNRHMVFNKLVYLSDIRALEIKAYQFKNKHTMIQYLAGNGYQIQSQVLSPDTPYGKFLYDFYNEPAISTKLYLMFEAVENDPSIESQIMSDQSFPSDFKDTLCMLGKDICERLLYDEHKIWNQLILERNRDEITTTLLKKLEPGQVYPKKQVKGVIQSVYDGLGLGLTATATDLSLYFAEVVEKNYKVDSGKRQKGYKINKL